MEREHMIAYYVACSWVWPYALLENELYLWVKKRLVWCVSPRKWVIWRGFSHINTLPTKLHGNNKQICGALKFNYLGV
jgi:hypothetical protein